LSRVSLLLGVALVVAAGVAGVAGATGTSAEETPSPWSTGYGFSGTTCSGASVAVPEIRGAYYGIEMVPTRRVPGTGNAIGLGKVTFARSPYGVSVTPDGTYLYDLSLSLDRLKRPKEGVLTAWVTTSDLANVERLGALDDAFRVDGRVEWNRFLVVVTLEPSADAAERWQGPIVLRGMSRSGMMHTMAGHGPFEKEPCAKYGFR
jgi:hypothetical protein